MLFRSRRVGDVPLGVEERAVEEDAVVEGRAVEEDCRRMRYLGIFHPFSVILSIFTISCFTIYYIKNSNTTFYKITLIYD